MRPTRIFALALVALVIVEPWACPAARAVEGASSNYTPGTYGNLAVARQTGPRRHSRNAATTAHPVRRVC
jgi:hypothetical protein